MLGIQILRWKEEDGLRTGKLATAAPYGTPLGAHATDALSFAFASSASVKNFLGVLTRDAVSGGPTFVERLTGERNAPNLAGTAGEAGMELPDATGGYVTARMPEELEVDFDGGEAWVLTSGTGAIDSTGSAITPGTTEAALTSASGGSKWRIKQGGDVALGLFTAKGLTDANGGATRVRIKVY